MRVIVSMLLLSLGTGGAIEPPRDGRCSLVPKWRSTPPSDKALAYLHAKDDVYPEERAHEELRPRLEAFRALLRGGGRETDLRPLIAPSFQASRLTGPERALKKTSRLEIVAAGQVVDGESFDARTFPKELAAWMADFQSVTSADVEAVEVALSGESAAEVALDFDVVGPARAGWRTQKTGRWRTSWQKADGQWRLARWTAVEQTRSTSTAPLFVDATASAVGALPAFQKQLRHGADYWRQRMDSVLAPDVTSHSGVAAADVDGDGLDDLYIGQPSGLPNRLFRNQGDGTFVDITDEAGVGILDASPTALLADIENDGDPDLIVVTWTEPLLFVNDGKARFTQRKGAFQFQQAPQGVLIAASIADYDRDGFLDLYLATYNYFVGKGEAALPTPYHDAQNGPPNVLFRNDGRGRFVDVTRGSGLDTNNNRLSLAPAWADYDGDGWIDLVVANDFGRKNLYRNLGIVDGTVRFEDVAPKLGVEDIGAGMSSAWLDYDNDGFLDLYVANMWMAPGQRLTRLPAYQPQASAEVRTQFQHHAQGNSLFRNDGAGGFDDVTLRSRTYKGRWAWASDALDFDNDGWEDIYVTNGMITNPNPDPALGDLDSFYWRRVIGQTPLTRRAAPAFEEAWTALIRLLRGRGEQAARERKVFFHNNGDGTFSNAEGALGLDVDPDGRAMALSDFDLDGDLDVFLKHRSGPQLQYFRNDVDSGHASIAVRLIGVQSNRDAVGAIVRVETDRGRHTKVVQCGSGYLSQRSLELLFGLGESRRIVRVTVTWPSGLVQELTDVPVNHRLTVTEGQASFDVAAFHKRLAAPAATPAPSVPDGAPGTIWLYQRYPAPDFTLADLDGAPQTLSAQKGRPVVLHFWSAACAPCREGLQALARGRSAIGGAGATLWTINVDGAEARARTAAFLRDERLALPTLVGDDDVVGLYSVLHRYLFDYAEDLAVPTTFLIDGAGEIAAVHRGAADGSKIAADVAALDAAPAERLARALPFPGSFLGAVKERPDFLIGMDMTGRGFEKEALVAFERAARRAPDAYTHYNLGTLYMKRGERARAELSLQKALALQPEYPEAQNSLGVISAERGDLDESVRRFQAALASRPDFADAMNNLGYTLLQADRVEDAVALFRRALEIQPDFPEVYNNLGIYYGQEGDLAQAESHFAKAVEQRPTYSEAVNNLAMVYGATDRAARGVELLERCLAADPQFEMTYVVLARLHAQAGRRQDALKVLEKLLQKNPRHPAGLQLLNTLR